VTRTVGIVGDRSTAAAFIASREGQQTAREVAASVFADGDVLAAYERGEELDLHPEIVPAVEHELDRLIAERNARWDKENQA
jgi:hypothetical protein